MLKEKNRCSELMMVLLRLVHGRLVLQHSDQVLPSGQRIYGLVVQCIIPVSCVPLLLRSSKNKMATVVYNCGGVCRDLFWWEFKELSHSNSRMTSSTSNTQITTPCPTYEFSFSKIYIYYRPFTAH